MFKIIIFYIVKYKLAGTGGIEASLDITYEPSKLGDIRTQLLVTSSTGGDYVCPLYGHCIAPRPQGPIIIKPGSATSVQFKNVFSQAAMFSFVVVNIITNIEVVSTMLLLLTWM